MHTVHIYGDPVLLLHIQLDHSLAFYLFYFILFEPSLYTVASTALHHYTDRPL